MYNCLKIFHGFPQWARARSRFAVHRNPPGRPRKPVFGIFEPIVREILFEILDQVPNCVIIDRGFRLIVSPIKETRMLRPRLYEDDMDHGVKKTQHSQKKKFMPAVDQPTLKSKSLLPIMNIFFMKA